MNKTSGKQHAYLNKFQVRHSRCRFSGLTDDLTDFFAIRRVQKRTKPLSSYSFKPNRIFFSGTTATQWLRLCTRIQCGIELFEMEMTPCLRYSLSGSVAPAEDLELTITPRGVWCSCTCECVLWSLANQQKNKKQKSKQILLRRLCALLYAGTCCAKLSWQEWQNIFEGGVIYRLEDTVKPRSPVGRKTNEPRNEAQDVP